MQEIQNKKLRGEPVVMLTCYDFPTAVIQDASGVDIIFVGDSVGPNILGYRSMDEVTMDDMLHHLRAVRRGVGRALLLVDMPYGSYESCQIAVENAKRFLREGADAVKLEGGQEVLDQIKALREEGIEVCGHIGFTPQSAGLKGRVVGKTYEEARRLLEDAKALDSCGIFALVLELVPEELSRHIARTCKAVVIGIGSGRGLDGEVQVVTDILGITPREFRHTKRFTNLGDEMRRAITTYVREVKSRSFPEERNVSHLPPEVYDKLILEGVLKPECKR